MSVKHDDIWLMWALWHWNSGIVGHVYPRQRDLKAWAIGGYFRNYDEYRKLCGKGKPYRLVKVDVTREVE